MAAVDPQRVVIGIKGAGDLATGVAVRLWRSGFSRIFMMELAHPLAVRRTVSFCETVYLKTMEVDEVTAIRCATTHEVEQAWRRGAVAVLVDERWSSIATLRPNVLVDAIIAKKNLGTNMTEAPLVIGLGPGFTAGVDVHRVVETKRGHNLGKVIERGSPAENTGVPGKIAGFSHERLLRSPAAGTFAAVREIAEMVEAGDVVGVVGGYSITAGVGGVLRGLIRSGTGVCQGMKVGDIDPRGDVSACFSISDKARAIGGGVLEAIMAACQSQKVPG